MKTAFLFLAALAVPSAAFAQHEGHDMAGMEGMDMGEIEFTRSPPDPSSGSGTSRLPGNENSHHGLHIMSGEWMFMLHGYVWGVYSDQGGPRGGSKTFVNSMAMLQADRNIGGGAHLQLRTMMSLEPLMKHEGYPNLFATGETASGAPLVDRQHPHDLFMELSAKVDLDTSFGKIFLYGGPVAEPALGPSAFMHRASARLNPEAPITHHWFDSTHISYGVITAGVSSRKLQLEASAFRGREPDEFRWNIETPKLDSWSVRGTWNPSSAWSAQISYGHLKSPEELEPTTNEGRFTTSVSYARGGLSATAAFSSKQKQPGRTLTAWLAEANWDISDHHTIFGRVENVNNDELFPNPASTLHDQPFRVSKFTGGYGYTVPITGNVNLALGGSASFYAKPAALDAAYGRNPVSYTLFAKLSLGR
jgi:hypothetical protein